MTTKLKGDNKVTQGHSLVEALHKSTPLTLQESRIVLTTISTLQPQDTIFDSQRIPVRDLLKLFNITDKNYALIEKACDSLSTKVVKIKEGKDWTNYPWFQKIKYHHNEGIVEFQFPNDLKPYLLEIKKEDGFTSYRLENILQLSSSYAHRIYEICYKWQHAGGHEFELEHLKALLGATKKSYAVFGSFKQKILVRGINEINEKTDIKVKFEEIKEGRKVVAIRFSVQTQNRKKPKKDESKKIESKEEKIEEQPQITLRTEPPNFNPLNEFKNFLNGEKEEKSAATPEKDVKDDFIDSLD